MQAAVWSLLCASAVCAVVDPDVPNGLLGTNACSCADIQLVAAAWRQVIRVFTCIFLATQVTATEDELALGPRGDATMLAADAGADAGRLCPGTTAGQGSQLELLPPCEARGAQGAGAEELQLGPQVLPALHAPQLRAQGQGAADTAQQHERELAVDVHHAAAAATAAAVTAAVATAAAAAAAAKPHLSWGRKPRTAHGRSQLPAAHSWPSVAAAFLPEVRIEPSLHAHSPVAGHAAGPGQDAALGPATGRTQAGAAGSSDGNDAMQPVHLGTEHDCGLLVGGVPRRGGLDSCVAGAGTAAGDRRGGVPSSGASEHVSSDEQHQQSQQHMESPTALRTQAAVQPHHQTHASDVSDPRHSMLLL